jgi:DNA-binding XRE family transcriptional regulator
LPTLHRVRILRIENELTVRELAELAGVSPSTVYKIENGSSPFKTQLSVAERLAWALDVKVSDLFLEMELSPFGRPAGTGSGTITLIRETFEIVHRVTVTREIVTGRGQVRCNNCFLEVPSTPHCTQCGKEL